MESSSEFLVFLKGVPNARMEARLHIIQEFAGGYTLLRDWLREGKHESWRKIGSLALVQRVSMEEAYGIL